MSPALIALLPFLGALLPGLLARAGRGVVACACGAVTLAALIGLLVHVPAIIAGEVVLTRIDWIPQLGLGANFRLDGLGLLFAILILGIGLLIILYARFYLSDRDPAGQFYGCLMLFQGAMTGIVLSDNILLLLIFWELTSLSSFLLIGFWKHLPEGRQGARMALTVTGLGGLAMIAGMLILGHVAGSFDITDILAQRDLVQSSPLFLPALILILLGAFTKSAQFPFHFWLPRAMAAPTPVSAYLHSATMVKAGLFLMARLWPVLAGTPEWFWIVTTAGLATMLIGAWIAIWQDDLKALLAWSTVSHLGLITMLLGFGTQSAAFAAMLHIIMHASFKAALFMVAGIVDHETGTRSFRRLGGLRRLMPMTFAIGAVAALSMAGMPPLNGFLSKEMMLQEVFLTAYRADTLVPVLLATLGAVFSVCYALRFVCGVFLGPERDDHPHPPHDPGAGLWAVPALLGGLVIAIGLLPNLTVGWLADAAASATTGAPVAVHLALWHGLNPALVMSLIALIGGAALLAIHGPLMKRLLALPRPDGGRLYDALVRGALRGAQGLGDGVANGSMGRALAVFLLVVLGCGVLAWSGGGIGPATRPMLPVPLVPALGWLLLVAATVGLVVSHRDRLVALVMIGIVGLMVSVNFVYLSAPDLALTQISVEVVTIILMLIALNVLPRNSPVESSNRRRGADAMIATLTGLAFGGLAYAVMRRDFAFPTISDYMLDNSYRLGGGDNVVNVILVDFRGYDTYGEVTVLGIAALVIFALTQSLLAGRGIATLGVRMTGYRAGDPHPMLLAVAARMLLPLALVVGLYIFLRGHNEPGGGFVAGLVVSVALVVQYMASGFAWAQARQRLPFHSLIGLGVLVAGITGIAAWFWDQPFLRSTYGYVHLPFLDPIELASAAGFDLGVFLGVVGAMMLSLGSLVRIGRRARMGQG